VTHLLRYYDAAPKKALTLHAFAATPPVNTLPDEEQRVEARPRRCIESSRTPHPGHVQPAAWLSRSPSRRPGTLRYSGFIEVDATIHLLTERCMSVILQAAIHRSTAQSSSNQDDLRLIRHEQYSANSTVLPVRGGATIRPRWLADRFAQDR